MGPTETSSAYRAALAQSHETVVLRRVASGNKVVAESRPLLARVTGYRPDELVAGIQQGDLRVLLLADDVAASGFPLPLQQAGADRIVLRGRAATPQAIDDSTRRVAGVLIAYEIRVRG